MLCDRQSTDNCNKKYACDKQPERVCQLILKIVMVLKMPCGLMYSGTANQYCSLVRIHIIDQIKYT